MSGKTRQAEKATEKVANEVGRVSNTMQLIRSKADGLLLKVGGGEKRVSKITESSKELENARNAVKEAEAANEAAVLQVSEASSRYTNLQNKLKGKKNLKSKKLLESSLNEIKNKTTKSASTYESLQNSLKNLSSVNSLVTNDAIRQVRNKGIKRLSTISAIGALGAGFFPVFFGDSQQDLYDLPQDSLLDNNQLLDDNQQQGFKVDLNGNLNYYYDEDYLTPGQYIQGSNGYVYNKQTGLIVGTVDDIDEARSNGYNNIFDYRANKAGYHTPEEIRQLQTKLGVTSDGKWGELTLIAFDNIAKNWSLQYDPDSLFSIYQRKLRYGY